MTWGLIIAGIVWMVIATIFVVGIALTSRSPRPESKEALEISAPARKQTAEKESAVGDPAHA